MTVTDAPKLSADEIVQLCKDHTIFSWSAQGKVHPIVIDRAEGICVIHSRQGEDHGSLICVRRLLAGHDHVGELVE